MPSIPEEVVIGILLRLPIKSLLRFRCVCKIWLHLLSSDPHFLKLHLEKSDDSTLIVQRIYRSKEIMFYLANYNALDEAVELEFPFDHSTIDYLLVGICNGLVCLVHSTVEKYSSVYIWNPSTKHHFTIPSSRIPIKYPHYYLARVGFGFGFDQENNVYKVVKIFNSALDPKSLVRVYTLGRKSWRVLKSIPYKIGKWSNALINGNPHWLAILPIDKESHHQKLILSFSIKDEVFREVQMPSDLSNTVFDSPDVILGELNGFLCIFHYFPEVEVHIWMLTEYGVVDSWSQQFIIGRPEVHWTFDHLTPMGMMKSGEILLKKNNVYMLLYDPESKSVQKLKNPGFWIDRVYKYTGSLVIPRVINAVASKSGKSNKERKRGKRKRCNKGDQKLD